MHDLNVPLRLPCHGENATCVASRRARDAPFPEQQCQAVRAAGKPQPGDAELDTGFEHVFDMRDGKVVRFENKPDNAEAWIAGWTG